MAEEFPELCETEQQAMAAVIGTHVQRLATIVNGNCACTTHVPLTPAPSPRRAADDAERSDAEERRHMTAADDAERSDAEERRYMTATTSSEGASG